MGRIPVPKIPLHPTLSSSMNLELAFVVVDGTLGSHTVVDEGIGL